MEKIIVKDSFVKVEVGGKSTPLPPPRDVTPSPKTSSAPSTSPNNNKK